MLHMHEVIGSSPITSTKREPRSNPWFLFICVKGVAGVIVKTKVAEKKISYDWLTKPRQNGKFVKKTK